MELKEGMLIYYLEDQQIQVGKLIDLEKANDEYLFSIDGYGTCEGYYRISSRQIGRQYFLDQESLNKK